SRRATQDAPIDPHQPIPNENPPLPQPHTSGSGTGPQRALDRSTLFPQSATARKPSPPARSLRAQAQSRRATQDAPIDPHQPIPRKTQAQVS
ncbi:MAG: hypothetical protein NTY84_01205, partial [Verrucomicrobia bacterium]|nr:hypothetical protein [Verrucomicrobiota bacterium]